MPDAVISSATCFARVPVPIKHQLKIRSFIHFLFPIVFINYFITIPAAERITIIHSIDGILLFLSAFILSQTAALFKSNTGKECAAVSLIFSCRDNCGGACRSIATVDENGKVTAKKAGTVKITVTTSNGLTATVKIKIK
ncbi:MAG: Ig-like domain-containing protein [Clostridia bacterium]|nr:Ig-like domain-containing protein [Clostridia bacterium]